MKVDEIELLTALKQEQKDPQKDIPDEEKIKVADDVHQWLRENEK